MFEPKPPTGNSAGATWFRHILEYVRSIKLIEGRGYRIKRTTRGTAIELLNLGGGFTPQAQPDASVAKLYRVKEIFADVYRCHQWDGTTEATADVYIAKNAKLRNSVASETIDGSVYTYSYDASFIFRTAFNGTNSELQEVIPRVLTNDVIIATEVEVPILLLKVPGDPAISVTWMDLNWDGRAWCSTPNTEE